MPLSSQAGPLRSSGVSKIVGVVGVEQADIFCVTGILERITRSLKDIGYRISEASNFCASPQAEDKLQRIHSDSGRAAIEDQEDDDEYHFEQVARLVYELTFN